MKAAGPDRVAALTRTAVVLVCVCLAALPAGAEPLATGGAPGVPLLRVLASLIICGFALFAVVVFLRGRQLGGRFTGSFWTSPAGGSDIAVLETRKLSLHADLCRFRVANEEFVAIVSAAQCQVLVRRPVEAVPKSGAPL